MLQLHLCLPWAWPLPLLSLGLPHLSTRADVVLSLAHPIYVPALEQKETCCSHSQVGIPIPALFSDSGQGTSASLEGGNDNTEDGCGDQLRKCTKMPS